MAIVDEWYDAFERRAKAVNGSEFVSPVWKLAQSLKKQHRRVMNGIGGDPKRFEATVKLYHDVLFLQDFIIHPDIPTGLYVTACLRQRNISVKRAKAILQDAQDLQAFTNAWHELHQTVALQCQSLARQ